MDWNSIIQLLLGGTTIAGIVTAIVYRKQNKKIKDSEATQSRVKAQGDEIDLANKYRDEMLKMVEIVKDANEKNFTNQDEIIRSLTRLEQKVGYIEEYLNGGYHQFLKDKQSRYNPNIKNDEKDSES